MRLQVSLCLHVCICLCPSRFVQNTFYSNKTHSNQGKGSAAAAEAAPQPQVKISGELASGVCA